LNQAILPVGEGPAARYSSAGTSFDSVQGAVYIFGGDSGCAKDNKCVGSASGLSSDTWFFDQSSSAWEQERDPILPKSSVVRQRRGR
jgi:hypothetical protein